MKILTIFLSLLACGQSYGKFVSTADIQVGDSLKHVKLLLSHVGGVDRTDTIGSAYFLEGKLVSARCWKLADGKYLMVAHTEVGVVTHVALYDPPPVYFSCWGRRRISTVEIIQEYDFPGLLDGSK